MEYKKVENKFGKNPFKSNDVDENATTLSEIDTTIMENANEIFETTKITDLNTHCMEAVFKYLGFNDLVNIVESSKQFYTAACEIYRRNFASQPLMYCVRCNQIGYYYGYFINQYILN